LKVVKSSAMPTALPARIAWGVEHLELTHDAHVLEIGCGAGHALGLIVARLTTGTVTGLDRSETQLMKARGHHASAIASGRILLIHDTLERATFPRGYDRVLAINVNAFWTTPWRSVPPLARCLAPGGRLWIVYEPPSPTKLRELEASLTTYLAEERLVVRSVVTERIGRTHLFGVSAQLDARSATSTSGR